jgi:hypothetical protein
MYVIPSIGSLELRVTAAPARTSQILRLDITDAGGVVTSFEPTVAVTPETQPTATEAASTPTPQKTSEVRHQEGKTTFADWLLVNLMILGTSSLLGVLTQKRMGKYYNLHSILAMGVGGYLAYLYLAFGLPGTQQPIDSKGSAYILFFVFIGMISGFVAALIYYWLKSRKK